MNTSFEKARRSFADAKHTLSEEVLTCLLIPAREAGTKASEAARRLYYSDVAYTRVESLNKILDDLPEPERLPRIYTAVSDVISAGTVLSIAVNAEAARKAARKSSGEGGYSYPTSPEAPATPEWRAAVKVGDYFLVRYGNGTQLVHVFAVSPVRLCVWRLVNRGTKWARWRSSSIKRTDARILGPSRPVAGDPA